MSSGLRGIMDLSVSIHSVGEVISILFWLWFTFCLIFYGLNPIIYRLIRLTLMPKSPLCLFVAHLDKLFQLKISHHFVQFKMYWTTICSFNLKMGMVRLCLYLVSSYRGYLWKQLPLLTTKEVKFSGIEHVGYFNEVLDFAPVCWWSSYWNFLMRFFV